MIVTGPVRCGWFVNVPDQPHYDFRSPGYWSGADFGDVDIGEVWEDVVDGHHFYFSFNVLFRPDWASSRRRFIDIRRSQLEPIIQLGEYPPCIWNSPDWTRGEPK